MRKLLSLAMISFVFLGIAAHARPVFAIGMSPPEVTAPNALNGIAQSKTINISRNPLDKGDLYIKVDAKGEYAQYLSYEKEFTIPEGQDTYPYTFDVLPTTAAPGTYRIPLFFILSSKDANEVGGGGSGSKIETGVAATVYVTVTGERVVGFEFAGMEFDPLEAGMVPSVAIGIRNVGNVDWRPESMDMDIQDQNDPAHLVSFKIAGEKFKLVGPGKTVFAKVELPEPLIEGEYVATAKFYDQGSVVGSLATDPFTVYAKGTLSQSGELSEVTAKKTAVAPGERILLDAVFKNTGQTRMKAVLMTEVFKDGTYVDIVRGEELEVGVSQETSFSQEVTLADPGAYVLTSYIKFGSQKSTKKDVSVTVELPKVVEAVNSKSGIVGLSVGIVVLVLLMVLIKKIAAKLKARRSAPAATVVQKPADAPITPEVPSKEPAAQSPSTPPADQQARW